MPSVVVFGASGFIGAPYIKALKQAHPDWQVTAYVRNPKASRDPIQADRIVVGDFSESEKISALSKEHDIAVNAGNSFTGDPVAAIISGLKAKAQTGSGPRGKLLHISGAGNFIDHGTSGNFNPESKVWHDGKVEDIEAIHKEMFNGQSDTLVLEAGAGNALETYIVCPSIVYGGASVSSPTGGIGYSLLTGNAKALGYVPYVGDGTAVVSTIHILDLTSFLLTITDLAASPGPVQGTSYERYYMLETSRVQWKDVATQLAKAMHARGLLPSSEPKNVPFEQAGEGEVKHLIAANMLIQGDRAAAMGFKAKGPGIMAQMHDDLAELSM